MNILKFMPEDKQLHLLGGGCVAGAFLPFGYFWSFIAVLGFAVAKETYDYFDYGKFDLKDIRYTQYGGSIVLFINVLIKILISLMVSI